MKKSQISAVPLKVSFNVKTLITIKPVNAKYAEELLDLLSEDSDYEYELEIDTNDDCVTNVVFETDVSIECNCRDIDAMCEEVNDALNTLYEKHGNKLFM